MRSISCTLPGCLLLCLAAQGAAVADDAAPVAPAVPALPPAVELVMPPGAVEWSWIVPAAAVDAADDGDVDVDVDVDDDAAAGASGDEGGERLTDKPPPGVAPVRLGTIRFLYEGTEPAAALRIVGTVPDDLEYVAGSATGPGAEVEYDAAARQLSWTIAGPLDPGTRGLVSFRAVPADTPDPATVEAP